LQLRYDFVQQFEAFSNQFSRENGDPGDVSARLGKTCDGTYANRSAPIENTIGIVFVAAFAARTVAALLAEKNHTGQTRGGANG